jgi:hypothetical protein
VKKEGGSSESVERGEKTARQGRKKKFLSSRMMMNKKYLN